MLSVTNTFGLLILFLSLSILSCRKKSESAIEPRKPDIYVTISDGMSKFGRYLKNGKVVGLPNDQGYIFANSVFVAESDVYVAGQSLVLNGSLGTSVGRLWKNGSATNVDKGIKSRSLLDIVVSEGDVYIAGQGSDANAAYWKNGVAVPIDQVSLKSTDAKKIFVSGKDVYVAGTLDGLNGRTAVYWKNGKIVELGDSSQPSEANSVVVVKNDVYAAGYQSVNSQKRAVYWKNGVATFLTDGSEYASFVFDMAISGNDVYCVGGVWNSSKSAVAKIWKNGFPEDLPGGTDAFSIFLFDNDIYVAGAGIGFAMYWKNGKPFKLPGQLARSIFVKNP